MKGQPISNLKNAPGADIFLKLKQRSGKLLKSFIISFSPNPILRFRIISLIAVICTASSCKRDGVLIATKSPLTDSIIEHANKLKDEGRLKTVPHYLDSAFSQFKYQNIYDLYEKDKYKAEFYLYIEKDYNKANLYADSLLFLLKGEETGIKMLYVNSLFVKGNVLMAQRQYANAFNTYYSARTFAKAYLDTCDYAVSSFRIALTFYRQQKYERAIPYLLEAISENCHCKPGAGVTQLYHYPQNYYNTLGLCYERLKKADSAIYYYKQAILVLNRRASEFQDQKNFNESAHGVIYGNLGGVYSNLNDYTNAEKYLMLSININNRPGYDPGDAQTAGLKLVDLYIRYRHFEQADQWLKKLEPDIFSSNKSDKADCSPRIKWFNLKWKYYDGLHNPLYAYRYALKYYNLRDSVNEVNKSMVDADLDEVFRNNEARVKMAMLGSDNHLKTNFLLAVVIFSTITVILILFLWKGLKRSRYINKQISGQNIQLQNALSSLEQSQAENTRMMRIVAHDLRNPIGGIFSVVSLMLEEKDRTDEDRMFMELIKTSAQNSLELVTNMLQVNANVNSLKKEPVDLTLLLTYCVNLLVYMADAKKQKIELTAKQVTIWINQEKMWRVISNLITNAIKFSPVNSVIKVGVAEENGFVTITVEDHGIGIPDSLKDNIFDMFNGPGRIGTAGEQTFGLGLTISKQIVVAHGGSIWFENSKPQGSTFFVKLPFGPGNGTEI